MTPEFASVAETFKLSSATSLDLIEYRVKRDIPITIGEIKKNTVAKIELFIKLDSRVPYKLPKSQVSEPGRIRTSNHYLKRVPLYH